MDISKLNQASSLLDPNFKKKNQKKEKKSKTVFSNLINSATDKIGINQSTNSILAENLDGSETLESLLDEVHNSGENLTRNIQLSSLKSYKCAIGRFLNFILQESYTILESEGINNPTTMKRKKYTTVNLINEKLENLAVCIIRDHADQLEILRKVDEINGILIDFKG